MGHNLNIENGKAAFFSVKEKAWHGLGAVVQEAPNSAEAIRLAGLDYIVEKRPLVTYDANGELLGVPNNFANVRTDNEAVLGVVGNRYEILQNTEAFEFFDAIVGEGEAIFETAGALGKGERIFITAKLPDYIQVQGDDIEKYLFLTNSHDGSGSITAAFTPIRVVCNNTLNAAMKNLSMKVNIRHTKNASDKLKQAHKLMGITNKLSEEMQEVFEAMAKKQIVSNDLKKLIVGSLGGDAVLNKLAKGEAMTTRMTNMVDSILEYAESHPTQQTKSTNGTLFGAYNAMTGYFQNAKEFTSSEKQLVSIFDGTAKVYSQNMFSRCVKML